jgi:hypothetical protein
MPDKMIMLVCSFTMRNFKEFCVISGFGGEVDVNFALLGCYVASSGNFLPTFRDNLSVPSSRVKNLSFSILFTTFKRMVF